MRARMMGQMLLAATLVAGAWACDDDETEATTDMGGAGGEGGGGEGGGGAGGGGAGGGGAGGGGAGGGGAGGGGAGGEGGVTVPEIYAFDSRFSPGTNSVAYDGQTLRHVLINDLNRHIGGLTARLDAGTLIPAPGGVAAELLFYYDFDGDTGGDLPHAITTTPATAQTLYNDISSGKNLAGKVAGNDAATDHKDWSTEFVGFTVNGAATSPDALIRHWFERLDALAVDRANGTIPLDPVGNPITRVYLTPEGLDLQQLIQKTLGVAIAFSQGADDYLDDGDAGKGLLSDNTAADGDKPYTPLEHQWDEGFGYFGAAIDFLAYTDDELAAAGGRDAYKSGYHDTNGDGAIDLLTEFNFGHSTNAAKRDRGAKAPIDLTQDAIEGFLRGRAIITAAGGALSESQMAELKAARDQAEGAWEKAIAATALHYINDTLQDMAKFGTPDYDFADHAKHWGELKGFALGLQFNPRSPMNQGTRFADLHRYLGEAPKLPGQDGIEAYAEGLRAARLLLVEAYGFDAANIGGPDGEDGW